MSAVETIEIKQREVDDLRLLNQGETSSIKKVTSLAASV